MNLPHPVRFLAMTVTFLFVGTYLAVCDWWDNVKARRAGSEPETSND
jgi:hypothetical protein